MRGKVARFLHAPSEEEIVFTSGTTEAINLVSYGWAAPRLGPGDEIVLSILEHHANIVPWHFLRERQGVSHGLGQEVCPVPLRETATRVAVRDEVEGVAVGHGQFADLHGGTVAVGDPTAPVTLLHP